MDVQSQEFQRLGIIADWHNPYNTMDPASVAHIIEQLGIFLLKGHLYRGLKSVMWSVVEKTALAEAEIEYQDHTSDSIYVSFPITHPSVPTLKGVEAVIWTTTPWTLPGNRAIAFGDSFTYVILNVPSFSKKLLIAKELLPEFAATLQLTDYSIEATLEGVELSGSRCAHPLHDHGYTFEVPLLPGEHVTIEAGTGLVHTAPGHGVEDFELGKKFHLEVPETVGPDGLYYEHVPVFAGDHVYKVNPKIMALLETTGYLLQKSKIIHSYPHSWRSKAPLIFRATTQWFISMEHEQLRQKALQSIAKVRWFPEQGRNRINGMVENRPDWCLSRQRAWGTPLTVFTHKKTGAVLRDPVVHQRIVDAVRAEGGDAWFSSPASRFLSPEYAAEDYEKVTDILDVWFDSGCTHSFVLKNNPTLKWPADLYLEGSDQHRGWFQHSLLEACGTMGTSPYTQVLTHGFVLDEKGYKMSKSLGTGMVPEEVVNRVGADVLRLWVASTDTVDDMRIGSEILSRVEDTYRRFRNTLRYLLGALDEFTPEEQIAPQDMPLLEQWILHRLTELDSRLRTCAQNYSFLDFYNELHAFCAVDLSAFYFDIRKDCLYCDAATSRKRRATRTVMDHVLNLLIHWLAPVLSFTAEEAYFSYKKNTADSIHLQLFPTLPNSWRQSNLASTLETLRDVRRVITGALEIERTAKTIGSSLQATVTVYVSKELADLLKDHDLAELGITSTAQILIAQPPAGAFTLEDVHHVGVIVNLANGNKCVRCWKVLQEVGKKNHPDLCSRCETVVTQLSPSIAKAL
jgi:isoleucyl-tRNA synthetase